jgi:hydrogenase nickel incorporation protein HypA/HybF
MHELSIILNLVEIAEEAAQRERVRAVRSVRLRVGAMAGVVKESLLFCYEIASEGTLLAGSRLDVTEVPVVIHCPSCDLDRTLAGIQNFCCPVCGTPSADIRQGKELEVESLEVEPALEAVD